MQEYKARISQNGRLVLPIACRRALGLAGEDELIIKVKNHEATIFSAKHAIERAQKMVAKHVKPGVSLVDQLIAERRLEAKNE